MVRIKPLDRLAKKIFKSHCSVSFSECVVAFGASEELGDKPEASEFILVSSSLDIFLSPLFCRHESI
jgi:hypothetical protein